MERKLATIQKITRLFPIEGADRIEGAEILGWECVVNKNEFKEGDLCVYFEIDSQLPIHPVFEFMANRHYRVKTAKFKKQISQGLTLPLEILDNFIDASKARVGACANFALYRSMKFKEGDDVTKLIGVTKYDPRPEDSNPSSSKKLNPIVNSLMQYALFRKVYRVIVPGKTKGSFPEFIFKTDETRIQSSPSILTKNRNEPFYFTEKLDGSSATYFYNDKLSGKRFGIFNKDLGNGFGVCSRNLRLVHKDNSNWWKYALDFDMEHLIRAMSSYLGFSVAVQGELIGPNIQENKYKRAALEFYCYNIFNINSQIYVSFAEKYHLCEKFGIPTVPVVAKEYLTEEFTVPYLVALSKRESVLKRDVLAEGIVGRNVKNDSISFKVINPEWLLKYKE